jgi:hypothetical protein
MAHLHRLESPIDVPDPRVFFCFFYVVCKTASTVNNISTRDECVIGSKISCFLFIFFISSLRAPEQKRCWSAT